MKKYMGLMGLLVLTGCMGRTPESSFYTFAPRDGCAVISQARRTIDVGRVRIAEYIDRPQMVTTDGARVTVNQTNRWAEGLGQLAGRRVITNLNASMPNAVIKDATFGTPGDCHVDIEIFTLDGILGGDVRMDAIYTLGCGDQNKTRRMTYTAPAGDDYVDYATSVGGLIDQMSDDIARDMNAI